jgi:hypothetical protein
MRVESLQRKFYRMAGTGTREVIKKEDWVLVNGNSNGWARRRGFCRRTSISGQWWCRSCYGLGVVIGAALALKGTGKLPLAFNPTVTC